MIEHFMEFKKLIDQNSIFWFCALLGTGMFIIQFLLSIFGSSDHGDLEGSEVDAAKIKGLSIQAITGFLMMFGWTALACHNQFHLPSAASLAIASTIGMATVVTNGFIFKIARKLHSSGSTFRLEATIGKEAVVYQRISKGGTGKISISLHDMTYEIDAASQNGEEIPSFASVRIIQKADDNTLIVIPK
jgi:membrane protein implicated in regulation of membrane protease activity